MNLTKTYKITCLSGLYFFQLRDLSFEEGEEWGGHLFPRVQEDETEDLLCRPYQRVK